MQINKDAMRKVSAKPNTNKAQKNTKENSKEPVSLERNDLLELSEEGLAEMGIAEKKEIDKKQIALMQKKDVGTRQRRPKEEFAKSLQGFKQVLNTSLYNDELLLRLGKKPQSNVLKASIRQVQLEQLAKANMAVAENAVEISSLLPKKY